jgi:UDP-N-acetylmuramoyl-tripeptide--D-alanyl-D-alanine ligase
MKKLFKNIVVAILTWEAQVALKKHAPKIIAVTGNVGKTSTKDAIYEVVSSAFPARKSQKSMNSEIGLPLTILGLDNAWGSLGGWVSNLYEGFKVAFFAKDFPEWLVLEVGADHPRDIESVSQWLFPDVVVLTRMSDVPVHMEYFTDAAAVLREKMFLATALKPDGVLVVNADDPLFMNAVRNIPHTKVLYGEAEGSAVQIVESKVVYGDGALPLPVGQGALIKIKGVQENISLHGVLGAHLMYSIAAACAVGTVLNLESKYSGIFRDFETPRGRMRILPGISASAIIDDTYNSSPLACAEALKALGSLSIRGRKVAVLADMKELGDEAEKAHRTIGRRAFEYLHTLVTVGEMGKVIAEGAREARMANDRIHSYQTADEAGLALVDMVRAGDVVLVKGSQSMRMERVSKALLEDKSKAEELLVRQEKEWTVR